MIRHTLLAGLAAGLLWAPTTRAADDPKSPAGGVTPQTEKINELIAKGYEAAGVKAPAKKASDLEFMRRVFVDLLGRVPTVEEILDFEKDTNANKRVRLVQRLLNDKQ